jgi:diphosphomevalonate decarboxylase
MSFSQTELLIGKRVRARAHINIALIKYWGKAPQRHALEANLPAVPSLSLTLREMYTDTIVRFNPGASADSGTLNGAEMDTATIARCRPILDRVRELADVASPFHIESVNAVPTAAGLASSASSMAALAAATAKLTGLEDTSGQSLSELARLGSGSASRSVFGGWVTWDGPHASPLAPESHWDVSLVIGVVARGRKKIGSREAMNRTAKTSPLYAGWVQSSRELFERGVAAVRDRDLPRLCDVMELSALRMHASAMGAEPPVLYWKGASMAGIETVRELRDAGLSVGWTMDAGPNLKVLCATEDVFQVKEALESLGGFEDVLVSGPGPGVSVSVDAE